MRLRVLILASLLGLQSTTSFAQSDRPQYLIEKSAHPESDDAVYALDQEDQAKVARALIDFQICKKELADKDEALETAYAQINQTDAWWAQPGFVVGGMVVSFSLGAVVVATKCFGACPGM